MCGQNRLTLTVAQQLFILLLARLLSLLLLPTSPAHHPLPCFVGDAEIHNAEGGFIWLPAHSSNTSNSFGAPNFAEFEMQAKQSAKRKAC